MRQEGMDGHLDFVSVRESGTPAVSETISPRVGQPAPLPPGPGLRPPNRLSSARLIEMLFAFAVLGLLATVLLPAGWRWWGDTGAIQATDDAYVQGDFRTLAARVPGYIASVDVADFQQVTSSQPLLHIEDDDYRAKVAYAQGVVQAKLAAADNAAAAERQQQNLIAQAEAQITVTKASLDLARIQLGRARALLASPAGLQTSVDQATASFAGLQATLAANQAALAQARGQLDVLAAQKRQAEAEIVQARASLQLAQIDLDHTVIRAPVDGQVGRRAIFTGQYVSAGTGMITMTPSDSAWVVANFRETQLTRMHVGQKATITVDSLPDLKLNGHVAAMSPASGSVTALLPPDNATGNFTKIVQRIPVKVALDIDAEARSRLLLGMSCIVRVDTASASQP